MDALEGLKADLSKVTTQLEQAKAHAHQLIGIQGYLEGKIAELEKPPEAPKETGQ